MSIVLLYKKSYENGTHFCLPVETNSDSLGILDRATYTLNNNNLTPGIKAVMFGF
jgi:hypothetical protein